MLETTIDTNSAAVLVIDMQRKFLDSDSQIGVHPVSKQRAEHILLNARRVIDVARDKRIPVIFVRVSNIPGLTTKTRRKNPFFEFAAGKKVYKTDFIRRPDLSEEGTPHVQIMPELAPKPDEIVLTKTGYSAFYGTNLEIVLRRMAIDTLLVIGVNTDSCVLSTAFDAHARDYKVIVIEDCCGSMYGDDMHEFALRRIRVALGWVATSEDIISAVAK
jgi:nicotinamidase-related amidase